MEVSMKAKDVVQLERRVDDITGRKIHSNPINKKRLEYNELESYMMQEEEW